MIISVLFLGIFPPLYKMCMNWRIHINSYTYRKLYETIRSCRTPIMTCNNTFSMILYMDNTIRNKFMHNIFSKSMIIIIIRDIPLAMYLVMHIITLSCITNDIVCINIHRHGPFFRSTYVDTSLQTRSTHTLPVYIIIYSI